MREVLVLVGIGLALGLVASWGLGRCVGSQLYGVTGSDPLTIAGRVPAARVGRGAGRLHPRPPRDAGQPGAGAALRVKTRRQRRTRGTRGRQFAICEFCGFCVDRRGTASRSRSLDCGHDSHPPRAGGGAVGRLRHRHAGTADRQRRRRGARRPRSHPRRQDAGHRRRGLERQPAPGHDARRVRTAVPAVRLQAIDRRRAAAARGPSRRGRRTSPTSRAWRRRSRCSGIDGDVGYNVAANGTATRAVERRREGPARRALPPSAHASSARRSIRRRGSRTPRTAGGERVVDVTIADGSLFTLAIDADDEAADARRVDDGQRQPRRRRDRHQLRRLSGRQRPEAPHRG